MADDNPAGETMDKLAGYLTLALTVTARIAEVQAHRRAQEARQAARLGEEHVRRTQERTRAEATVAKQQLRGTGRKEWWDKASVEEVAVAYATARAYGQVDGELAGMARGMADEIRKRYGVDADDLVQRTASTEAWMGAVGTDTGMAASEKMREAMAQRATAVALVVEADVADKAARQPEGSEAKVPVADAAEAWDSGQRRASLTERLQAALPDQPEAVSARLATDALNAKPAAAAAAAHGPGSKSRARNVPSQGQERARGR